jgi:hypothetical protein
MVATDGYYEQMMPTNQMHNLMFNGGGFTGFGASQVTSRQSIYIQAQNIQTIDSRNGSGQKTTFEIPRSRYLDLQTLAIQGNVRIVSDQANLASSGGANSVQFTTLQYGFSDLVNRMVLYIQGTTPIEDVRYYNRIRANMMIHNNTAQWFHTSGGMFELWGRYSYDNFNPSAQSDVAPNGPIFYHTPMFGFLAIQDFYPAFLAGNLQIDIYWEDAAAALVTSVNSNWDGVTLTGNANFPLFNTAYYIVSNLRLYYDVVSVQQSVSDGVMARAASDTGMQFHYNSFEVYENGGISTGSFDVQFPVRLGSIKSVFLLTAPYAFRSTRFDYLMSQLPGWQQAQFRVNNDNYPQDPMTDEETAYRHFCKALGNYNTMYRGGIVRSKWLGTGTTGYNVNYDGVATFGNGHFIVLTMPYGTQQSTSGYPAGLLPYNLWEWGVRDRTGAIFTGLNFVLAYEWDLDNDPMHIAGLNTAQSSSDITVSVQRDLSSAGATLQGLLTPIVTYLVCLCDKLFTIKLSGQSGVTTVDK